MENLLVKPELLFQVRKIEAIIIKKEILNMEAFDPALHYGPNDAGISAINIIAITIAIIIVPLLFSKIYSQVLKILGKEKSE